MDFQKQSKTGYSPRSTRRGGGGSDVMSQVTSIYNKRFKPMKLICDTDYVKPDNNEKVK